MGQVQHIPLEEKDFKQLKRRKLFQFILLIYLSTLTLIIIGMAVYMFYSSFEQYMGLLAVATAAIMFFVVNSLYKSWQKLKEDVTGGVKSVVQGVITDRYSIKNNYEFRIDDVKYQVSSKYFYSFELGQTVLVSFAPKSKRILDIKEIKSDLSDEKGD